MFWYGWIAAMRAGFCAIPYGHEFRRDERPVLFWIVATARLVAAIMATLGTLVTLSFEVFGLPP